MATKIESGHGLLYLSQIIEPKEKSEAPKTTLRKVSGSLSEWGFNLALPIVCLTDEEEKYRLLTGLPIYEAAQEAGLKQIWVFLVAAKQEDAEKAIAEAQFQSGLNERIIELDDLEKFRDFLNNNKSPLTSIPGIKDGYAKLIKNERPFNSISEMKKKLGAKRCLNWLKGYKKVGSSLSK
jgi:hypothetical protein